MRYRRTSSTTAAQALLGRSVGALQKAGRALWSNVCRCARSPRPRVRLVVHLSQAPTSHVRVDLGGREADVPE